MHVAPTMMLISFFRMHVSCCDVSLSLLYDTISVPFFVPKVMNSELERVYLRTFCNFATAVNGLLWDLLMWFEDMSHAFWGAERGLGYFQEDYMGWKRSRVGTDYDAYCYLFFWPKIKERKAPVAQSRKTGLKAQKHLCSSSRWFHFLIMIQTSNVARQVFLSFFDRHNEVSYFQSSV